MPWRVYRPAVVVGHSETGAMDKVDGPYYFFPVLKRLRDTAAVVAAAGRRRPRRHQRGAGRLRRQGDGPPRAPARPRRRGLPPGQPRAAEHRRAGQRVRRGRPGAAVRGAGRPATSPRLVPTSLLPRPLQPDVGARRRWRGRRRRGWRSDQTVGRLGIPPEVLGHVVVPDDVRARGAPRRRSRAPASPSPTSRATPRPCGATGRSSSTTRSQGDAATVEALSGKTVVITGASSGIGQVDRGQGRQGRRHPDPGRARAWTSSRPPGR